MKYSEHSSIYSILFTVFTLYSTGCAMKLGTAELLHEDRDDKKQIPPAEFEMEEEFLEPGDTDDIVLVTVIAVVGLVLFTNIILGIGYLKSKCKRKASRGKDLESNETKEDAINLLNRIANEQQQLTGLLDNDKEKPYCKSCRY